jgi:hypothetical protein
MKSPALINHIIKNTPIKDVVFGGDVITTTFENPKEATELGNNFRRAFDVLVCNKYYIYGNHDNNSYAHIDDVKRRLTDEQVYEYLQRGMSDCIYGDYFNFYFDRKDSKTRIACLDTGRYTDQQNGEFTIKTVKFLTNVLTNTPDNWRIVLLSHLWYDLNSEHPRRPYLSDLMRTVIEVLDNFNARVRSVYSYHREEIEYDFTQMTSRIVCCVGGHCHLDAVLHSEGGIPIIITTTDSTRTINDERATAGTVDEHAISVFIFDYSNDTIKMFRIGRGKDIVVPFS